MFCIPVDVVDNFLDKQYFQNLQNVMFGKEFTWFYIDGIDYPGEEGEKFQFTHTFYKEGGILNSPWHGMLDGAETSSFLWDFDGSDFFNPLAVKPLLDFLRQYSQDVRSAAVPLKLQRQATAQLRGDTIAVVANPVWSREPADCVDS